MITLKEEKKISSNIVGIDEVGRGPLAGPVIAAAVILPPSFDTTNINDSKKLSLSLRNKEYEKIINQAEYSIGVASIKEIEDFNILKASLLAMKRALAQLKINKNYKILVDGPWSFDKENSNIVPKIKGDSIYPSIAAASIVAKVYRDNLMKKLSNDFPEYGWNTNFGYGTKKHISAINKHGITEHHRKSFAPIHKMLSPKLYKATTLSK